MATKLPDDPIKELDERERAIALLSFLPETKHLTLYCSRTGVPIADMNLIMQVGKVPYLSQWKEAQSFHPLFSLPQSQLLAWTRKNWNQLFRNTASDHITDVQKQQFQIAFMAILHSLECIDQQAPALPSFQTVCDNLQQLLELAYWYNYLDSKRFRFPTLRINKLNANLNLRDISAYLEVCESKKHDWETSKEAKFEDAKLLAAQKAEKAVRSSHVRAISKKALWNWFLSSLLASNSKKYSLPEWQEWKEDAARLWFANENGQLQFSSDDVNDIENVFLSECTIGTVISHAFASELEKIRNHIENHRKIFEIDLSEVRLPNVRRTNSLGEAIETPTDPIGIPQDPGKEPQLCDYNSRAKYIQARARWDIQSRQYQAYLAKQQATPEDSHDSPETGE
jgi:hypothetical protein